MMSISKSPYLYYPLGYRLIPLFTELLAEPIVITLLYILCRSMLSTAHYAAVCRSSILCREICPESDTKPKGRMLSMAALSLPVILDLADCIANAITAAT
jgi:hypothetical protein|eukprot:COSAG03_NODE_972_length_5142_cov_3.351576_3_plen_100_part_00